MGAAAGVLAGALALDVSAAAAPLSAGAAFAAGALPELLLRKSVTYQPEPLS
ncbi:hypothetical protein D559_3232 [Bordetella holmesii 1058]|uniref:N-acetyltransferase YedL n=1 Tax=Bordetella holmesii 1058 TaxID=1247648 RepID=A0ABN0S2V4_9BORD|nr:hypothetical protein D558_1299 [Bordetella holmesii 44057]EXX95794.1 hypothetical protein D559_3232 [Bordetella holmesii 1058]